MTFAAVLSLDEAPALALADALAHDEALTEHPVDLSEAAAGRWEVVVYFDGEPHAREREALDRAVIGAVGANSPGFTIAALPETDWVKRSLTGLNPIRAGRFLVHGRHDRNRVRANDIAIEIEANEAFGTGHHGSTLGCLVAIDWVGKARVVRNALDLGTGSGILAIAIARSLKVPVLASDIDPTATRIAAANAALNRAGDAVTTITAAGLARQIFRLRGPFDLIVANILANPLVKLAPAVRRHLAANGLVILSGLLPEQRARVVSAYRGRGLRLVRDFTRDGWLTLIFERKPARKAEMRGRPARVPRARGQRSRARRRRAPSSAR
jgi:ribosomal protein L11 methyltransferase